MHYQKSISKNLSPFSERNKKNSVVWLYKVYITYI